MNLTDTITTVQIGDDVYGSDGDKVGAVADVQPTYLVVEKGFFFPTDYYIPLSAITQVTDGQVVLNVSRDTALHSGWEIIPDTTSATFSGTDTVTNTVADTAAWHGRAGAAGGVRGHQRG